MSRVLMPVAALAIITALTPLAPAHAGTYVINNCPAAPAPNGDAGPWVIFDSPQPSKGSCGGGAGDWIGPRAGSMGWETIDGVQVTAPAGSGITIHGAKVWWYVPHEISGALTYALALADGTTVGEYTTPAEWTAAPSVYALPSTTTTFKLEDFCSNSDGDNNCVFGGGVNPNLELFGSQLTLADSRLPTGKVTGGALAGTVALSGTQSLAYSAQDTDTGVRLVRVLIDGQPAATNDYLSSCPYTNFQACPADESDTISWNTATVPDGQHTVQALVEDAAQNTSTFYDGTIITENAPTETSPPSIPTSEQPVAGSALSALPGGWSAPAGAGSITYGYQWEGCDTQGNGCQAIPGAQGASYTTSAADAGHTLRVAVSASDSDGLSTSTSAASATVTAPQGPLTALPDPGTGASPGLAFARGAPNGIGASESAQLRISTPGALARTFAKRAFRLTGRLLDGQGAQIAGASLDILAQTDGASAPQIIGHLHSAADGSFSCVVPAGPSRQIILAYRAFSVDPGYATEASVQETVGAGVQLHISPRHASPTGAITLSGRVAGPIPPEGVVVELLVHYRGHWEPFRTPRTTSAGRFAVAYQFQGSLGRFPFRAAVFGGQSRFPYQHGESATVAVTTG
jgi:hypothetical protein